LAKLSRAGNTSLGIGQGVAEAISRNPNLKPQKTTAGGAFLFCNIVAGMSFPYSLYLTFIDHWWWFLIGMAVSGVIANANKGAN